MGASGWGSWATCALRDPRHSDAGRGRRHAPPAESNYILFSVRPPLAPFLRCELRSLRPLRTGRAGKLTQYQRAR